MLERTTYYLYYYYYEKGEVKENNKQKAREFYSYSLIIIISICYAFHYFLRSLNTIFLFIVFN